MFPSSCVIDTPVGGDPITISRSMVSENQSPWAMVPCYFHDPTFSHFGTNLTCDGRMGRNTRIAYSTLAKCRAVSKHNLDSQHNCSVSHATPPLKI